MSNLQLIASLCGIVEEMSTLVHRLASKLEEMDCISEEDLQLVRAADHNYSAVLGAEEFPDDCPEYPE